MCGILAWDGPERIAPDSKTWAEALRSLHHRGPDDQGTWSARYERMGQRRLQLGHARLSIVDLSSAAAQPMVSKVSGSVLIFNGQLYNFRELKQQLSDFPYSGHGDTEVLLAALDRWGVDAVTRVDGMFAFAWWNAHTKELVVARDRLGIKPLYFARQPRQLSLASELRALRQFGHGNDISQGGLSSFLAYGSVYEPDTIFDDIRALAPGTVGTWDGSRLRETRYWSPAAFVGNSCPDAPEQRVRHLVSNAVQSHLVADAKLGVFLSSGLDSSVLAAESIRRHSGTEGLTLSFGTGPQDEAPAAKAFAADIGLPHRSVRDSLDDIENLFDDFMGAQDQPSIDGLNTWLISRAAKEAGFKVMLSGLGADELFYGYESFRRMCIWEASPPMLRSRLLKVFSAQKGVASRAPDPTAQAQVLFPWLRSLWSPNHLKDLGLLPNRLALVEPTTALAEAAVENRLSHFELTHYLRNTLLRDSDTMSMAHGLELRVPFLDKKLVEFSLSLSPKVKWNQGMTLKGLLRAAYADVSKKLPTGPKRGFQLPFTEWFSGPLRSLANEALNTDDPVIPRAHREKVSQRFAKTSVLGGSQLLQLVIWRCWYRRHAGPISRMAA